MEERLILALNIPKDDMNEKREALFEKAKGYQQENGKSLQQVPLFLKKLYDGSIFF